MIPGVNFQPQTQNGGSGADKPASQSVQEAIQVLSLRLPKVLGARAVAPAELLNAQGSGGGRVDSVVNQVLERMFGGGDMNAAAPMIPSGDPQGPSQPGAPPINYDGNIPGNTPLSQLHGQMGIENYQPRTGKPSIRTSEEPPAPQRPPDQFDSPTESDPTALMEFLWRSPPPQRRGFYSD